MRDWMIKLREDKNMTLREMAMLCNIGFRLAEGLEELDWVTQPGIADMVAAGYGMNVTQRNALCRPCHHVKKLSLPSTYLKKRTADGKSELFVAINADCIMALMRNLGKDKAGISTRLAYSATWLHARLKRGTMKADDIRRLAKMLGVSPKQLMATKPE